MNYFRSGMLLLIGLVGGLILGKSLNNPIKTEWLVVVGIVLLLVYLTVEIFQQTRNGLQAEPSACPKCGAQIKRIHRSRVDRVISVFVPNLRRYACKDSTCKWSALVKAKHGRVRTIKEKTSETV
jgi:hypothetical protein